MDGDAAATGTTAPPVTVVQNLKAPTPDRMREARLAWVAARAQFLG